MKRAVTLAAVLFLAAASQAQSRRRAVTHPSPPPPVTFWTLDVTTIGMFAPDKVAGVTLRSSGAATLLSASSQPICNTTIGQAERALLVELIAQARPETWARSYGEAGGYDDVRTTLRLTRNDVTYETFWWPNGHGPLPADLSALYSAAYSDGKLRARFDAACFAGIVPQAWSIQFTDEGGFAYRFHHITVDALGHVLVQPNYRAPACTYILTAAELQSLTAFVANTNAAAWSPSYVRPENPNGCCDQIHTSVQLMRSESTRNTTYATHWYSDHPPLPADLESLYRLLLGNGGAQPPLFEKYGAMCGPLF